MRTTVLELLNTKNNLYNNICLSLNFFSPAVFCFLPRTSLLQRAEAGEGLTPDDAIGTSGGVSAGGHDLRDPSRHTWRRDADPSHTDQHMKRSARDQTIGANNTSGGRLTLSGGVGGGGLTGEHTRTTRAVLGKAGDVAEQHSRPALTCLRSSGPLGIDQRRTYLQCYTFLVCLPGDDVTQHNRCHFSLKEART